MEIRRSNDRLISTMGFPILVRWHLYIESGSKSYRNHIKKYVGTCYNTLWLAQISIREWRWMPFPRILSRNGQMTLKVKVSDPYFQYQLRVSQGACLVQIWWFQIKSVRSYSAGKVKLRSDRQTDGRMGGRTNRRRRWQNTFGLKGHGVKKHNRI